MNADVIMMGLNQMFIFARDNGQIVCSKVCVGVVMMGLSSLALNSQEVFICKGQWADCLQQGQSRCCHDGT